MALRYGFTITWKVGKNKKEFCSESYREVELKKQEQEKKGYRVSKIEQCIF